MHRPLSALVAQRRHLILLVAFTVAGVLYGVVTSRLPAPHSHREFWISNLSTPWLVLPFLAGRAQRSTTWGFCTGALASIGGILGFYAPGLARSWEQGVGLDFYARWLAIAAVTGPLFGALGSWRDGRKSLATGIVIGLAFVFEPWAWTLHLGFLPRPYFLWVIEMASGLVVTSWLVASRLTRSSIRSI